MNHRADNLIDQRNKLEDALSECVKAMSAISDWWHDEEREVSPEFYAAYKKLVNARADAKRLLPSDEVAS